MVRTPGKDTLGGLHGGTAFRQGLSDFSSHIQDEEAIQRKSSGSGIGTFPGLRFLPV